MSGREEDRKGHQCVREVGDTTAAKTVRKFPDAGGAAEPNGAKAFYEVIRSLCLDLILRMTYHKNRFQVSGLTPGCWVAHAAEDGVIGRYPKETLRVPWSIGE